MHFWLHLFSGQGFIPRARCGVWTPALIWTQVLSQCSTWLSYMFISGMLCYFVFYFKPPREIRVCLCLYAAFIPVCGQTHLIDALMFWVPAYRVDVLANVITAIISVAAVADTMYVIHHARSILARWFPALPIGQSSPTTG